MVELLTVHDSVDAWLVRSLWFFAAAFVVWTAVFVVWPTVQIAWTVGRRLWALSWAWLEYEEGDVDELCDRCYEGGGGDCRSCCLASDLDDSGRSRGHDGSGISRET